MKTRKATSAIVAVLAVAAILITVVFAGGEGANCPVNEKNAKGVSKASTIGQMKDGDDSMEKATFGAGCFWGVEAAFRQVEGVLDTAVGYSGGNKDNPTYKEVCYEDTGHTEVVQVTFDPEKVSYPELLDVFWKTHDPTQVNRQGPDVGWQYRSVIFFHNDAQKEAARTSLEKLEESKEYARPVATKIEPAKTFWKAEEYHQQYYEKHGGSCCRY